jgi:aryl-alcohol dehydrogenase-like predicted oxidoreductase
MVVDRADPRAFDAPAIGLGCDALATGAGPRGQAQVSGLVGQALDLGARLLAFAECEGAEAAELLVGRAIAGRREEAVIAVCGESEAVSAACEGALRRLGVDSIDLYLLPVAQGGPPLEERVGSLAELVGAGKVRHIGLACASAEQLRRAHDVHPVAAVSTAYSLLDRRAEAELLPAARELGATLIAGRPLAGGLLTDRIGVPHSGERAELRRSRDMLQAAQEMAANKDVGLSRLALAWLQSQPGVVPIPGTTNRLHLEVNMAAALVRLTPEESRRLAELFPPERGLSP